MNFADFRKVPVASPIKIMKNTKFMSIDFAVIAAVGLLSGCAIAPLKGGHATTSGGHWSNRRARRQPGASIAAGSRDRETRIHRAGGFAAGGDASHANAGRPSPTQAVVISAPMPVVEHEETRAKTESGAAQKDTARELSAKLASLKGIVWVGVRMFLFGLATLFYPPLQAAHWQRDNERGDSGRWSCADDFADADCRE